MKGFRGRVFGCSYLPGGAGIESQPAVSGASIIIHSFSTEKEATMKGILRRLQSVLIAIGLICSFGVPARAEKGSPGTDVHRLANRVRKVIKRVENNPTLPCERRNHLVKRLRSLHDALASGKRSAARALVMAWTYEARSHQAAGLLSAEHGAVLHNGLQGFVEEIGEGWPEKPGPTRKWDPLPACDSGGTSDAGASPPPASGSCPVLPPQGSWDSEDTLVVLKTFLGEIPEFGGMLSGLLEILWPTDDTAEVSAIIDRALECDAQTNAANFLSGLHAGLAASDGYFLHKDNWLKDCGLKDPNTGALIPSDQWPTIIAASSETCKAQTQTFYGQWSQMLSTFVTNRIWIQTTNEDYQLKLLPVFAQYETLYMSFLREGILMNPSWIASGRVGEYDANTPVIIMTDELNPNYVDPSSSLRDPNTGELKPDRGIAYVNSVYNRGLAAQPQPTGDNKWDKWIKRNAYIRDMTLKVLDYRDTWKFMDPAAYPNGVEGGVKLTRMLYTDPIGHKRDDDFGSFQPPANVAGPLTELTVWSQSVPTADHMLQYGSKWAISALQSTNPPTAGPARSGAITGDTTHDGTTAPYYLDLRISGPISEVKTYYDMRDDIFAARHLPSAINFKLAATGRWIHTGGGGLATPIEPAPSYAQIPWKYPSHVLAAAKAMGLFDFGKDTATTDSVIFGFRLYDSFFPSGALVNVRAGKCMDVQYPTAGTRPTIYSCSGGPGQIWSYDTNTKAVTIPDGHEGQFCLKATGTAMGSAVEINACTGAKSEQWELVPSANGLGGIVKSVESGLALDVSGGGTANRTPIVLWYPHGDTNQQWTTTSPLTGEVHAVGSGRCLDVKADNTANGTPVQIYDCNGGAAQAWTYNESAHTLSVHNGTKCLDASGTAAGAALRIWDCSGAANQQWTFNRDRTLSLANGLVLDVQSGRMTNESPVILASPLANRTSQQWSRPSRRGGNVHATYAGKCLDGQDLFDGTPAQIYDCLATPAPGQEWTYHPLTHRITAHGDGTEHCLSISGTAVVVTECRADPNQLWTLRDNVIGGTIVSTPSVDTDTPLCMTLAGTAVVMQACPAIDEPANPNQQWIWP
jgi:hypothetical protein